MKRKHFIETLLAELPKLEKQDLIDVSASERLRAYYSAELSATRPDTLKYIHLFLGILGCALLGTGVLLVIGHNWDEFPASVRIAMPMVPLVISMLAGAWIIIRQYGAAYREPVAVFISLLTLSSIALVSQQYHSTGTVADLGFAWMIVTIPLMYIFRANSLAVLVSAGILCITCGDANFFNMHGLICLGIVCVFSLPYYFYLLFKRPSGALAFYVQCAVIFSVFFTVVSAIANGSKYDYIFAVPVMISALYTLGLWYSRFQKRNAFIIAGGAACAIFLVLASYKWFWDEWGYFSISLNRYGEALSGIVSWWILVPCALIYAVVILAMVHFNKEIAPKVAIMIPALTIISMWFDDLGMMIIVNILLLVYSVAQFVQGFIQRSLWRVNYAMCVVTFIAFLRFLDYDKNILVYAFFFIGAGFAFLVVNRVIGRIIRKEALK